MTAKKGGPPKKSITIRGVEYPSRGAAAIALGVTNSRISTASKNGVLENVGLGVKGAPKKQIKVCGRTFDGLEAAAEFYGVSLQRFSSFRTVSKRIAEVEAKLAKAEWNGGNAANERKRNEPSKTMDHIQVAQGQLNAPSGN